VYLVEGGRARLRPIRTGLSNWERTEVLEGLEEGQHVIVSLDVKGLADGVAVRPANLPASRNLAW
ncbi:MAG: efflux RND transporter periplasmic adaptor subunit, partial [Deltaproteobacteria bacterium]